MEVECDFRAFTNLFCYHSNHNKPVSEYYYTTKGVSDADCTDTTGYEIYGHRPNTINNCRYAIIITIELRSSHVTLPATSYEPMVVIAKGLSDIRIM